MATPTIGGAALLVLYAAVREVHSSLEQVNAARYRNRSAIASGCGR